MLRLEDFMEMQKLHHDGWSVKEAPREYERKPKGWKVSAASSASQTPAVVAGSRA